jgi:hypothetical protein
MVAARIARRVANKSSYGRLSVPNSQVAADYKRNRYAVIQVRWHQDAVYLKPFVLA